MSTILKALKKLEQDKETLEARGMAYTVAFGTSAKDRPAGRPAGRWGRSKRLLYAAVIGVVFIGVAGAAVYFYNQSKPSAMQASRSFDAVRRPVRPKATVPVHRAINRSERDTSQSKQPPPQTKPTPQRKPPSDFPQQSTAADTVAQADAVPPKRFESRERVEKGQNLPKAAPPVAEMPPSADSDPAGPRIDSTGPATPTASSPPAKPKSKNKSAYAKAERLTDKRLKIQAIAWSPVPDDRMAVINSSIVREGGSVEGFSVVSIRSDDVIVREKGRLYRVVFGSP